MLHQRTIRITIISYDFNFKLFFFFLLLIIVGNKIAFCCFGQFLVIYSNLSNYSGHKDTLL